MKDNPSSTADSIAKLAAVQASKVDVLPVMDIPVLEPRKFDTDLIDEFLGVVFPDLADTDESILTWKVKPGYSPSYPVDDEALLKVLDRTKNPSCLYFGTATCSKDPADGKLYNRQEFFKGLYVVVLDDIGTKIPLDKIPKGFKPTYILETSAGNFQYGYVLEEPVRDLPAAAMLVQLMYESGLSDEGGKLPNKLVRLPEGVNGKVGEKRGFVTRIQLMDGPKWAPQAMLEVLELDVTWEDILEDADEATKRRARAGTGTSPWSPVRPVATALNGVIDPVLEWLYEHDDVSHDNGKWVNILCPWHTEHTNGNKTAGYMPLGRGDRPNMRAFHCFHDSCAANTTNDFLYHVAANDGPEATIFDNVAGMTAEWVYDSFNDAAWNIKTPVPKRISMAAFRNTMPKHVKIPLGNDKFRRVSEVNMWLASPARVTVHGQVFDPSTTARMVTSSGELCLNMFTPPDWGKGAIDERHVEKFVDFIDYLIPEEDENEMFLDWLAAKAQDMGFRGPALLMIAKRQGTGRTTLTDMLRKLFGAHNVETVPFKSIVGDNDYNEWLESPIVVSNETLGTSGVGKFDVAEKLKEIIDHRPQMTRINPKYGKQHMAMVHTSFIFMSNHENALALSEHDRRFYVISNPFIPASPEFFTRLNAWLDAGDGAWAKHIGRWLLKRDVNMQRLLAPAEMTTAKAHMASATLTPMDAAVSEIMKASPSEYIGLHQIKDCLERLSHRLKLDESPRWEMHMAAIFREKAQGYPGNVFASVNGRSMRPRVIISRITPSTVSPSRKRLERVHKLEISDGMRKFDVDKVVALVSEGLDMYDF